MEKISPLLLTFLLNGLWQVALVAAAASLASRLLKNAPARYRHGVWVAALLLTITLPMIESARLLPVRTKATPIRSTSAATLAGQAGLRSETAALPINDVAAPVSPVPAPIQSPLSSPLPVSPKLARILLGLYVSFLLLRLGALGRAWLLTRRIVRDSTPAEFSSEVERIVARCLQQTGARGVRFLCSESVAAPLTVGSAPAVVVLPEKLLRESDEAILTSAIGHELVHVQQRDYLLNFLYRLLSIPLSFHPAAALIRRRIDQTRELRCDEVVTDRLLSPTAYARSLVELAGAAHAFRRPATVAVGIADADILEERIMSMLKKRRISSAQRTLLLASAALVFAVPCIAAAPYALHLNIASPVPAASPTPAPVPAMQAEQDAKPAQQNADYQAGLKAGQAYAARTPGDPSQEERAKVKAEVAAQKGIAFTYSPLSGEPQSEQEGIARKKLEMKRRLDEENASPEEREARLKIALEEMQYKNKRLAELSKAAKITMQQAIEIATRGNPGTVMESSLMGQRKLVTRQPDGTFAESVMGDAAPLYRVVILSGDENDAKRTIVTVNAIDGSIVRSVVE